MIDQRDWDGCAAGDCGPCPHLRSGGAGIAPAPGRGGDLHPLAERMHVDYVAEVLSGTPVDPESFMGQLVRLVAHSDPYNRTKIAAGYPTLVNAYLAWMTSAEGTGWEDPFRGQGA